MILAYNVDLTTDIKIFRAGFSFWIRIFYEFLPDLCDNCLSIGHVADSCRKKIVTRENAEDGPAGTINMVSFPKRGNRNKKQAENIHLEIHTSTSDSLNTQVQTSTENEQDKEESFPQTGSGQVQEVLNPPVVVAEALRTEPLEDRVETHGAAAVEAPARVVETRVETLGVAAAVSPVTPADPAALRDSPPATYAQVLSGNRFALLSNEQEGVGNMQIIQQQQHEIIIPTTKEVWNTIQRSQQQMEKDLELIRNPPGDGMEEMEHELNGFVQPKSRSLKKISNTTKSLRRKVNFSAGKHIHSYALRRVGK